MAKNYTDKHIVKTIYVFEASHKKDGTPVSPIWRGNTRYDTLYYTGCGAATYFECYAKEYEEEHANVIAEKFAKPTSKATYAWEKTVLTKRKVLNPHYDPNYSIEEEQKSKIVQTNKDLLKPIKVGKHIIPAGQITFDDIIKRNENPTEK
ncbi:MAG: hypothetical protein FWD32_02700 [Firmicutes bacterium]|nr:hypothetical protein [Bacillota bacterium]